MNSIPLHHEKLLAAAAEGALVLTSNKRLTRYLRRLYDVRMQTEGRQAWQTPAIMSFEEWQSRSLSALGEGWRILSSTAADRLWEEVIETDAAEYALQLLQIPASARLAREADELLTEYGADCSAYPLTDDHRAFLRWRERFRSACLEGEWIAPADRCACLLNALSAGRLEVPREMLLVGFDELPPFLQRLSAAFIRSGCKVCEVSAPPPLETRLLRVAAPDAAEEVRLAARWARHLMDGGETRIGVISPDLTAYQPLLERIFREEIDPRSLVTLISDESSFNLTLGSPLSSHGPIAAALEILSVGSQMDIDATSFLLRNPYLGGAETEGDRRSLFDRWLRSLRTETFSLADLKAYSLGMGGGGAEGNTVRLQSMPGIFSVLDVESKERDSLLPGAWSARFSSVLNQVGWPGGRPLDSHDFQVVDAWREKLLPRFAALDAVSRPLRRGEAVALLRRLAGEEIFQPRTGESGLQVCGILEAGGLPFDHLWVLGLHEEAWPRPAKPNPFLPIPLQTKYSMPHADPGREALFAHRLMLRLQASAPCVVLSHPLRQKDCKLRPSTLIASLPLADVPLASSRSPRQVFGNHLQDLEFFEDSCGPALAAEEVPRGGTVVLKDQALCPFRAFAHHRLGASALEKPSPGIDPAVRGTLVHAVMEKFWELTRSHAVLCSLSEDERTERVIRCIDEALGNVPLSRIRSIPQSLLEIERNRLRNLVDEWLTEVEMKRTPFTCLETEDTREEQLGDLQIRCRIDRVDTLADGSLVVMDYKTGRLDLDDLLGERLIEPQLPIYGIGEDEDRLAAVAIASLRRGECALKGVSREEGVLPKTGAFGESKLAGKYGIAGWDALLAGWRRRLEVLSREFVSGLAAVDPIDPQKACSTCDLVVFCRVGEGDGGMTGEGEPS